MPRQVHLRAPPLLHLLRLRPLGVYSKSSLCDININLRPDLQQRQVVSRWTGDRLVHKWTTTLFGDENLLTGGFPFFLLPSHGLSVVRVGLERQLTPLLLGQQTS